jgi:hypothetical protein
MRVALWLVPAAPWREALAGRIDALARQQTALPFEPHVSVHVGDCAEPDRLGQRLADFAAAEPALTVRMDRTEHGETHFKTLFVTCDDPRVHALQARAVRALGLAPGYPLAPHLSLLYRGGLDPVRRAALSLQHDLRGLEVRFDELVIVRPQRGDDLSDQAGWDTSLRATLAGPA